MKIEVERGDVKVSVEVTRESESTPREVAAMVHELLSKLHPVAPSLPFGFSVWADTERSPEEVLPNAEPE